MTKRAIGIIALLGVLAAPAAVRARYFCRFTGVEITDCEEQRVAGQTVVRTDGCCERRVVPALAAARVIERATVVPVQFAAAPIPRLPARAAAGRTEAPPAPSASGPPIYVVQRTLLI